MTLSPTQTTALAAFRNFLKCPEEPVFLLRGYAGTGKTTLLKTLELKLALSLPTLPLPTQPR